VPANAIIHLDMDAFFASVEQRDAPELRGKPVIVGGHPRRGVVLAASYEVRPFGVHSAMPMAVAMRRAPTAVVVPPRMVAYEAASDAIFAIMSAVTPLIEPLSLDEAFLDVTASGKLFGPPSQIASNLRARIAKEVGLPSSAGIAPVKFVAKIASDLAKPNGQMEVVLGDVRVFLAPLPVGRLWGVGPKTEAALNELGLRTVGQIAAADHDWLGRRVSGGRDLWELACGIDPAKAEALLDVVRGRFNPAGKLPITVPANQAAVDRNAPDVPGYAEAFDYAYKNSAKDKYVFGFGLSYGK